jgi:hypothetical protein
MEFSEQENTDKRPPKRSLPPSSPSLVPFKSPFQTDPLTEFSKYPSSSTGPFTVLVKKSDDSSICPISIGKMLKTKNIIINTTRDGIQKENRNTVSINFRTPEDANSFITSYFVISNNLKAFVPKYRLSRQGLIRGIPNNVSMEEILEGIETPANVGKVLSARRLNYKDTSSGEIEWKPSSTLILTFEGSIVPDRVFLFYNSLKVEQYISPTVLCYNCCRYGHAKKHCKSPTRCYKCSKPHPADQCDSTYVRCINCQGAHTAANLKCPEYIRQRNIKRTMAMDNVSLKEASLLHPPVRMSYAEKAATSTPPTFPSSRSTPASPTNRSYCFLPNYAEQSSSDNPTRGLSNNQNRTSSSISSIMSEKLSTLANSSTPRKIKFRYRTPSNLPPTNYSALLSYDNGQATNPEDGCALKASRDNPSSYTNQPSNNCESQHNLNTNITPSDNNPCPPHSSTSTLFQSLIQILFQLFSHPNMDFPPELVNSSLAFLSNLPK